MDIFSLKEKEILPLATMQMNLEGAMLSELCQTLSAVLRGLTCMWSDSSS